MKLQELKTITGYYIYDSNNTTENKLKLLNFVKEASEHQIKHLLTYGNMISKEKVDKLTLEKVWPKVKTYASHIGMTAADYALKYGLRSIPIPFAGIATWAAYRQIRSWFDKCTKPCGKFEINSIRRQVCKAQRDYRRGR